MMIGGEYTKHVLPRAKKGKAAETSEVWGAAATTKLCHRLDLGPEHSSHPAIRL